MRIRLFSLLGLYGLFGALLAPAAWGTTIVAPLDGAPRYTVQGDLILTYGDDLLGLQGSTLTLTTSPGEQISYSAPHTSYAAGARELWLAGTGAAGSAALERIIADTWTTDGSSYDALRIGRTYFAWGDYELRLGQVNVNFAADFFGEGADALPSFGPDEVQSVSQLQLDVWSQNTLISRFYSTNNRASMTTPAVAAVPEPGSLLLMGLGFGALLMRRRLHREGSR